ncbi:uncharacterized protein C8Q71DRAFT_390099 [Rhodofomes roseus]|uniref:F-box domain-containing protein n=1 Tax=Rhodofomes roseus TaxID=34475 RepID=A0ABQ8K058_9APHY|nr:uncharacterized protein C8Q71DRAFT_390099 [Rhodofomes roseus]KAH9829837.1 hypothetical protein C8Q71DRAFT_390099 [Rhodofomes roseus]
MTTQTIPRHLSRLPPELWVKIVEGLPRGAARSCLFVNKLFHDVALPTVFARIALSFGAFEAQQAPTEKSLDEPALARLRTLEESRSRRALEILARIAQDQTFAELVRTLQIQACNADEDELSGAEQNERLLAAIPNLKNLRVFQWHWSHPPPTETIVQSLADSCPRLKRFEAPLFLLEHLPVHLLRSVECIRATISEDDGVSLTFRNEDPGVPLESLLEKMQRPLPSPNGGEACLLDNITDLELLFQNEYAPRDLRGILSKVPHLNSLTMVPLQDVEDEQQEEMYGALQALPPNLPSFDSFAIGPVEEIMTPTQFDALCSFLRGRPQLRAFVTKCSLIDADVEPLFEALGTLQNLQLLGLYFECTGLPTKEWLDHLLVHVPASLTALALDLDHGFANKDTFTELWSRLPALEFVYVNVHGATVLTPNQFIRGARNLRLVCFQDRFYDVERHGDELRVVMPPWPSRKVRFRTAEDFGCADWEWLMRHYSFFDYMPANY